MQTEYIYDLTIGIGDIRSRLLIASNNFIAIQKSDLPPGLHRDWEEVDSAITKLGTVEETMKKIKNSTGQKIAIKLFDMSSELGNAH